jgi:hypothetical protein
MKPIVMLSSRKTWGQIFDFDIPFFINTICQFKRSDPVFTFNFNRDSDNLNIAQQ